MSLKHLIQPLRNLLILFCMPPDIHNPVLTQEWLIKNKKFQVSEKVGEKT